MLLRGSESAPSTHDAVICNIIGQAGSVETDYMISCCSAAEDEIKTLTIFVVLNRT